MLHRNQEKNTILELKITFYGGFVHENINVYNYLKLIK